MKNKKKETIGHCIRDYFHNHFWVSLGVVHAPTSFQVYEILRCSQYGKCKKVELEFIR